MLLRPNSIAASSLPQNPDFLVVLPLSDLHLPKPASEAILLNRAYLNRADFVVLLGDMVQCYGTDAEYEAVRQFIGALERPFTPVCGNHEWFFEEWSENSGIYGEIWAQATEAQHEVKRRKFRDFYGVEPLYRAFDSPLGHFVFLSLDAVIGHKQECLSEAQLRFLEAEVARAAQKPLFVFCHAPLMLRQRLAMVYYDEERTACVELSGALREALETRAAPTFWMSGHIHLHPEHPLFAPYECGAGVWQIHCPDSWGYGRWSLTQRVPARYDGLFSRHLAIDGRGVDFVTHDHQKQRDIATFRVDF
ncbi:MAG TPA: metallophosphoesterase [Abditibacterium sp.]|jgi:hypothetical protein